MQKLLFKIRRRIGALRQMPPTGSAHYRAGYDAGLETVLAILAEEVEKFEASGPNITEYGIRITGADGESHVIQESDTRDLTLNQFRLDRISDMHPGAVLVQRTVYPGSWKKVTD